MKMPRTVVLALCLSAIACGHQGEPSGAALTGFVRGDNGVGLQGATVQVAQVAIGRNVGTVATTDATGAYRLDDLNPGRTTLVASANGYAARRQDVTVDGRNTLDFTLALGASPGRGESSLSGNVRTPSSTSVPGVLVTVTSGDDRGQTAITGRDGRYTFSALRNGPTTLVASAPDFVDASGSVTVGTGGLDFTMRRVPGSISETLTGTMSATDPGCLGDGDPYDTPCRRFPPFEVTNSGPFSATLTWQNDSWLALEVQRGGVTVAGRGPSSVKPVVITTNLPAGLYEIFIWGFASGTDNFSIEVTRPK